MAAHPAHAGLAEAGCRALRRLTSSPDEAKLVAASGGASALLNAMAEVPVGAVQRAGCLAIASLCAVDEDSARTMIDRSAGSLIIAALKADGSADANLAEACLSALAAAHYLLITSSLHVGMPLCTRAPYLLYLLTLLTYLLYLLTCRHASLHSRTLPRSRSVA